MRSQCDVLQDEEEKKLEQIRNSVSLPFHSFLGKTDEPVTKDHTEEPAGTHHPEETVPEASAMQSSSDAVDVITLEDEDSDEGPTVNNSEIVKELEDMVSNNPVVESDSEEEPMSLSELSSSFQKCLDSINSDGKNSWKVEKSSPNTIQIKPFDYEAARREVRFGENNAGKGKLGMDGGRDGGPKPVKGSNGKKNGSTESEVRDSDAGSEFRQGRRRLAFPASGNRSATFR